LPRTEGRLTGVQGFSAAVCFMAYVFCANPLWGKAAKTGQSGQDAEASPVEHAPKLDGTLDDPLWKTVVPITDFRQREPLEGQPATEKIEVRILYLEWFFRGLL
jgi:hypothetical protein